MPRKDIKTEVVKVDKLLEVSKPWCLRWQTATMPTPAFWYYKTEEAAREAEKKMLGQ